MKKCKTCKLWKNFWTDKNGEKRTYGHHQLELCRGVYGKVRIGVCGITGETKLETDKACENYEANGEVKQKELFE